MRTLLKSFKYAGSGIIHALRHERNLQYEIVIAILVLILMLLLPIKPIERAIVLAMMGLVLSLEIFNTAFEMLLDLVQPERSPLVKTIKDLGAGSVLVASFFAFVIGLLIFLPYFR